MRHNDVQGRKDPRSAEASRYALKRAAPWLLAVFFGLLLLGVSKDCRAQVNDKALHAGASAGIGLVLRNTMDSKHDAFALTLAAGVAKEMADRARPGGRFDGRDMLANAIGAAVAVYTPMPDEIGVALATRHARYNAGPGALNNNTPGIYAMWDIDQWGPVRIRTLAAAIRLSNDRDGALLGLVGEWGPVFGGGAIVRGYTSTHLGMVQQPGAVLECLPYCVWRTERKVTRLVPVLGVVAPVGKARVRLTYQHDPGSDIDPMYANHPRVRSSSSLTLFAGWAF